MAGFWDSLGDFGKGIMPGAAQGAASRDASRIQTNAGNRSIAFQGQINDQNNKTLAPYVQGGAEDYQRLAGMTRSGGFDSPTFNPGSNSPFASGVQAPGAAPTAPTIAPFSLADVANDPGYQFRLNQGVNAVQNSAAAKRGFHGGNALAGINNYAQGFASNEANAAYGRYSDTRNAATDQYKTQLGQYNRTWDQYNTDVNRNLGQYNADRNFNYGQAQDTYNSGVANQNARFSRLAQLAGYGQQGAQNLVNNNTAYGNNIASGYENIGNVQAAGRAGAANAATSMQQSGINLLGSYLGGK